MKSISKSSRLRAIKALTALLDQISTIRVKEIGAEAPHLGHEADILAHIELLGHERALACKVLDIVESNDLRTALHELRKGITQLPGDVKPVVTLPYLSAEAKALCQASEVGCLDLQGNAFLVVDDVFISMRSSQPRFFHRSSVASERIANAQSDVQKEGPDVQNRIPPASSEPSLNTRRAKARTRPH